MCFFFCFFFEDSLNAVHRGRQMEGSSGKDNASTDQLQGRETMSSSFHGCQARPVKVMSRWFLQQRGTDMTVK